MTDEIRFLAENDFNAGELILKDNPLVAVIQSTHLKTICSNCFEASYFICSACKIVSYCSRNCQKIDFKNAHKLECKGFLKVVPNEPSWMMRLLARLLYRIHNNPDLYSNLDSSARLRQRGLKRLQTHRKKFPAEKIQKFAELAMGIQLFVDRNFLLTPTAIIDLLCLISCNSLSVTDAEQEIVGVCISLKLSAINHSCIPNAAIVFSGSEAVLIALKDIRMGEEIFISYVDHTQSTSERQLELKKNYMFDCNCSMCRENIDLEPLSKFTHKWNDLIAKMDWRSAVTEGIDYCSKLENIFGRYYPRVAILQYQIFRCAKLIPELQHSVHYGLLAVQNMSQYLKLSKNLRNEYADWKRSIDV